MSFLASFASRVTTGLLSTPSVLAASFASKVKHKTRSAAAKRFGVTSSGLFTRAKAGRRHLAQTKNRERMRRLGKVVTSGKDQGQHQALRRMMPHK